MLELALMSDGGFVEVLGELAPFKGKVRSGTLDQVVQESHSLLVVESWLGRRV